MAVIVQVLCGIVFVPFLFEKLLVSLASLCHALFTPS